MAQQPIDTNMECGNRMLDASGITLVTDVAQAERLRQLAAGMVEVERTEKGYPVPWMSRSFLAGKGWSVSLMSGLAMEAVETLGPVLARHGGIALFGTSSKPPQDGETFPIWRIPNGMEEAAVPLNNFGVAYSGTPVLVLPAGGEFALWWDDEGDVIVLGAPAGIIREAVGNDPAGALTLFFRNARRNEVANGYPPGSIAEAAERYAPFLLRS